MISKTILGQYDLGVIKKIAPVSAGLVHDTFAIDASSGKYIIQRLHPVLASKAIAKDFLHVTRFLKAQGFPTPDCILTKNGDVLVIDGAHRWRLQTRLPGKTVEVIKDKAMARAAGEMYARFHKVLDAFPYTFGSTKILHQTEKIYEKFLRTIEKHDVTEVKEEVDFLRCELPKYFLPARLPMRVIHGDPKISNILFDSKGRAKAIIDLDTCNRRPLLVELGDAFRSWCGGVEDDPKNTFSLPMFRAAWVGYKKGAGDMMTKSELQHVPKAIGTITLELAARFLTDYFDDNYFGWDKSRYESRRAHNLARCRGQIAEFIDYKKKLSSIKKVVGLK